MGGEEVEVEVEDRLAKLLPSYLEVNARRERLLLVSCK